MRSTRHFFFLLLVPFVFVVAEITNDEYSIFTATDGSQLYSVVDGVGILYNETLEQEIRQELNSLAPPNAYYRYTRNGIPAALVLEQTPQQFYAQSVYQEFRSKLAPKSKPEFFEVEAKIAKLVTKLRNEEVTMEEFEKLRAPLSVRYDELLGAFNKAKDTWAQRVEDEIAHHWMEVLSEKERMEHTETLQDLQRKRKDYELKKQRYEERFDFWIQETTRQNQIANPQEILLQRYPDHEFPITQSKIVLNWVLAPYFLISLQESQYGKEHYGIPFMMVSNTNIRGTFPVFVDSHWNGWGEVYAYCPNARTKHLDSKPQDEQELQWLKTGYYKVYPPNDVRIDDSDDEEEANYDPWGHSLAFSRKSIRRYLNLIRSDLGLDQDAETIVEWTKTVQMQAFYTENDGSGDSKVQVTSFRTPKGDRLEVWGPLDGDGYALLQSHRGRVVVIAVSGGHAYLFCNLLEFYNSDGSMDMPRVLLDRDSGDVLSANEVVENVLKHAEEFLYDQIH